MKKLILIVMVFFTFQANAGLIKIEVDKHDVQIGESVWVTVTMQDFELFDVASLLLRFNTSLLSLDGQSVTSGLMDGILEVNQVSAGIAVSYLDFFGISGDFSLVSFSLTALTSGITSVLADDIEFYAPFAQDPLTRIETMPAALQVINANQVPEPASGILLFTLLLLLRCSYQITNRKGS